MRWGWLFNRFQDPHLRLSREQRKQALDIATNRLLRKLVVGTVLVVIPPLMLAMWVITMIDDRIAAQLGAPVANVHIALLVAMILLFWPWCAWVYGRMYTRPYRRALRELGVNICVGCGYPMDAIDRARPCPECGWSPETQGE